MKQRAEWPRKRPEFDPTKASMLHLLRAKAYILSWGTSAVVQVVQCLLWKKPSGHLSDTCGMQHEGLKLTCLWMTLKSETTSLLRTASNSQLMPLGSKVVHLWNRIEPPENIRKSLSNCPTGHKNRSPCCQTPTVTAPVDDPVACYSWPHHLGKFANPQRDLTPSEWNCTARTKWFWGF